MSFLEELKIQRWDDHRFYHHNRINQFLHFLSAACFLGSYALIFYSPMAAALLGWLGAMVLRQIGHFIFEPKTDDQVFQVTHAYKESVKVGYNLKRKAILLTIWVLIPIILVFDLSFFNTMNEADGFTYNLAILWLVLGVAALIFRTIHLFFIKDIKSGLVWLTKILTDPLHDIKIYHKSFFFLIKGEMYDEMKDWYAQELVK